MYYVKYNEIELTDMIKVREVNIPPLPEIEHSSIQVFERDGQIYNGANFGTREISITFIIQPKKKSNYNEYVRDVKRAFYTKNEARLFCGDETRYIWCVPVDDVEINELGEGCAEGKVTFISYNPYWYSTDQNVVNNEGNKNFVVENESDVSVYPIINIGFSKDTTFVKVRNKYTDETILVGGVPEKENETVKKNSAILKDDMVSSVGWVNTSAPIDAKRTTGGTLAVTSDGKGLTCGNFGSKSSDSVWHGACYKKSLEKSIKDFKVKVRMRHNSSGVNGDPSHPFQNNDTGDGLEGGRVYYQVAARGGLVLRVEAKTSSKKVCTIPYGTKLDGNVEGGWLKTGYNGKDGYCLAQYLKAMVTTSSANNGKRNYVVMKSTAIRTSPSDLATNKKTIPVGKCIRCHYNVKYPSNTKNNDSTPKESYYKLAKPFEGVTGYVKVENLTEANNYQVDFEPDINTADDKLGIVEIYGFSANNIQLFKLSMNDDNEFYEFTYPLIRKNSKDFLKDKTLAPEPKKITTYNGNTKKVENILSGKYGSWNEFYGELYIERVNNKWYAYINKIKNGEVVKSIKSKTVTDTGNKDELLNYLVIYIGTTNDADKACGMAVTDIKVYTATEINEEVEYNLQEFEAGDILRIDNSIPAVYLNDEERNDLVDVGSSFFALEPGDNDINISTDDDKVNVDILWNNKYL